MEAALSVSLGTRSSFDDDNDEEYNTEGARLFFGPLKTPERAMNAIVQQTLSSPMNQTADAGPSRLSFSVADDKMVAEDIPTEEEANEEQVARELTAGLAEDEEDDEGGEGASRDGNTDEADDNIEYMPNEPSFMLAERISHASSNPSPPPSPLITTSVFEDLSLLVSQNALNQREQMDQEREEEAQVTHGPNEVLEVQNESESIPNSQPVADAMDLDEHPIQTADASHQPDLINMDGTPEPPPAIMITQAESDGAPSERPPDSALSVIDDLLLDMRPGSHTSSLTALETPGTLGTPSETANLCAVDQPTIPTEASTPGPSNNASAPVEKLIPVETPPLRRSPRRSVNPVPTASQAPYFAVQTPTQGTPRPKKSRRLKAFEPATGEDSTEGDPVLAAPRPVFTLANIPATQGSGRSRSKSPLIFNREVGSLSPETSNLLSQLIPTLTDPTPLQLESAAQNVPQPDELTTPNDQPPVISLLPPQSASAAVAELSTPKRLTTPARPLITVSPSKSLLNDLQPANIPGTPARRITMEEAIETGQVSPVKAAQMGYTHRAAGPSTASSASVAPATPARRVLLSDKEAPPTAHGSSRAALKFGTPVRARSKGPEEQKDAVMADPRAPLASSSRLIGPPKASMSSSTASTSRNSRLPFPLSTAKPPPSVSKPPSKKDDLASTLHSPAKSSLKQLTATSRIPRIGAKPYARPTALSRPAVVRLPSTIEKHVERPTATTIRKVDLSKPSTNRMVVANASTNIATAAPVSNDSAAKGKAKAIPTMRLVVPPSAKAVAAEKPVAPLKRKRGPEPSIASPVMQQRPIRLVPSAAVPPPAPATRTARGASGTIGTMGKPAEAASSNTAAQPVRKREPPSKTAAAAAAAAASSSTASSFEQSVELEPDAPNAATSLLKPRAQTMRVIEVPSSPTEVPTTSEDLGSPMRQEPLGPFIVPSSDPEIPAPSSPPAQQEAAPAPPSLPTIRIDPLHHETPPIETLPLFIPVEVLSGVRRTSRLRKKVHQQAEVSGVESSSSSKPLGTRSRKPATQNFRFAFTDAYSEMSATALKNLTATNTAKNQAYLSVRLETAIIRKDGARPESPMVKIKTIAQREEEEKDKRRQERAARAARRAGGSNVSEIPGSSDIEADSEDDYDSLFGDGRMSRSPSMPRHQRGAGEEEDYQTPHRAFKRMKLTENGPEEEVEDGEKRVKWDRGLFTVVYLDEVKLGTRAYSKSAPQTKGCLAPTAKRLPLDTLGNLSEDAVPPLGPLSPENVVVKKFVYDTDIEPEPVPPPPPPPKQTRSKGKKAKS